jgi:hypothetical protein
MLAAFFQRQALSLQHGQQNVVDDGVTDVSCQHDQCFWNDAVVLSSRSACPSGKSLLWRVQIPDSLAGSYTVPGQFVKLRWNDTVEPLFLAMCSPPVSPTPQSITPNHHHWITTTTTTTTGSGGNTSVTADDTNGNTRRTCVFEFLVKTTPNITWLSNIGSGTRVQVSQVYGNGFPLLVPIRMIPPFTSTMTNCSSSQQEDSYNGEESPHQDVGHDDNEDEQQQQQQQVVGRNGILLVAAGSGIAPLKACIESGQLQFIVGPEGGKRCDAGTNNNKKHNRFYRLYYGEWTQDDLCFPELYDTWKVKYGIQIIPCLSRSPDGMGHVQNALRRDLFLDQDGDNSDPGVSGASTLTLTSNPIQLSAPTTTKTTDSVVATAFLCGMDDMVVSVTELLQEAGVPPERILINL